MLVLLVVVAIVVALPLSELQLHIVIAERRVLLRHVALWHRSLVGWTREGFSFVLHFGSTSNCSNMDKASKHTHTLTLQQTNDEMNNSEL